MHRSAIISGQHDLSGRMPKDPNKKTVQAHLTKDEYDAFHAIAMQKQWSDKRLNENIIREYLELHSKKSNKKP